MKALIPWCCALLLNNCYAQVSVGHRFGVAFSKWVVESSDADAARAWNSEQDYLSGFMLEVPVQLDVAKYGRISSGVGFVQKGWRMQGGKQTAQHGYLQFPISLGGVVRIGRFQAHPSIGAVFGLNMRGQYKIEYDGLLGEAISPIGLDTDKGYVFRNPPHETSALAQLILGWQGQRNALELGLAYQHGLTDVWYDILVVDEFGNGPIEKWTATQRSYQVHVGYRLSLAREKKPHPATSITDSIVMRKPSGFRIGQRFGASSSAIALSASLPEEESKIQGSAERLLGMATAVVLELRVDEHLSLQPEIAYTQKGWLCQWYPRPTLENDILRMNYAELPILIKYTTGRRHLRPYAYLGPAVAMGLGGVDRYHAANVWPGGFYAAEPIRFGRNAGASEFSQWDLSAVAGVGLAMKVGESELFLDLRYQHGFMDFVPDLNRALYSDKVEAYHRNWLLSLGYLVPWRK